MISSINKVNLSNRNWRDWREDSWERGWRKSQGIKKLKNKTFSIRNKINLHWMINQIISMKLRGWRWENRRSQRMSYSRVKNAKWRQRIHIILCRNKTKSHIERAQSSSLPKASFRSIKAWEDRKWSDTSTRRTIVSSARWSPTNVGKWWQRPGWGGKAGLWPKKEQRKCCRSIWAECATDRSKHSSRRNRKIDYARRLYINIYNKFLCEILGWDKWNSGKWVRIWEG